MTTHEIDGLSLHTDGTIGIGGTPVPQGAEFVVVQLGEWSLSKALGEGKPLIASRGDGRKLVFEYRNGAWQRSESDVGRKTSRPPQVRKRSRSHPDALELFEQLVTLPLDLFHWWRLTFAGERYRGLSPEWSPNGTEAEQHADGDVTLFNDGTAVLGSLSFPPGVEIDGYRFGGSVAYRQRGDSMLMVMSPGTVRLYYGQCANEFGGPYESLDSPGFRVGLAHLVQKQELAMIEERQTLLGWLKWKLMGDQEERARAAVYKDATLFSPHTIGAHYYWSDYPWFIYLSSEGTVYARLMTRFDDVGLGAVSTPGRTSLGPWNIIEPGCDTPFKFVGIDRKERITYKSGYMKVEADEDVVLIEYNQDAIISYCNAHNEPRPSCISSTPTKYLINRYENDCRLAAWHNYYAPGGWDWYKLTPQQGAVTLPEFRGYSFQLGGSQPRRLAL